LLTCHQHTRKFFLSNSEMSDERTEQSWLLPLTVAVLAVSSWYGYQFGAATLRPCSSSFEGGCGNAKMLAAPLSFLCAIISASSAAATASMAKKRGIPTGLVWLISAISLPGVIYAMYCVYVLLEYVNRN
jgi:hypothetical protein